MVPPSGSSIYNGPFTLGSTQCPLVYGAYTCYGVYAPAAASAPGLLDRFIVDLYTMGGAMLSTNHYNGSDGTVYIYTGSMYNTVTVQEQPVVSKIWYESPSQCVPALGSSPPAVYVDFLDAANNEITTGYLANPVNVGITGSAQFVYSGGSTYSTATVGYLNSQPAVQLGSGNGVYAALSFTGGNGLAVTGPEYAGLYNIQAGFATSNGGSTVQLTGAFNSAPLSCGSVDLGAGANIYAVAGGNQNLFVTDSGNGRIWSINLNASASALTRGTAPNLWSTVYHTASNASGLAVSGTSSQYVFVGDSVGNTVSGWYFNGSFNALFGAYPVSASATSLSAIPNAYGTYDVWAAGPASSYLCVVRSTVTWIPSAQCTDLSTVYGLGSGVQPNAVAVDPAGTTPSGMVRATYVGADKFIFFSNSAPGFGVAAGSSSPNPNPRSIGISGNQLQVATSTDLRTATLAGTTVPPTFSTTISGAFQAVNTGSGSVVALGSPSSASYLISGGIYPVSLPASTMVSGGGFNSL